ncbi:MAG: hypothetical protein WCH01_14425 [Methylococcaceae bacterium]
MEEKLKHKLLRRQMGSGGIRIVPILKQSVDIGKLGNAFISLAIELAEEKSVDAKNNLDVKDCPRQEKQDYGGSHHEESI